MLIRDLGVSLLRWWLRPMRRLDPLGVTVKGANIDDLRIVLQHRKQQ